MKFFFEICKWSPLSNHNLGLPHTPPKPFGTPPPPTRFSKKSIDQEIELKRFNWKIGHLRCYPSSSCVPCCNRKEGWPMYETSQEGSEGELSFLTFNKSDMHPLFSIAPLRFGSRKRWRDNAMTMARWYDGDHPMTRWRCSSCTITMKRCSIISSSVLYRIISIALFQHRL